MINTQQQKSITRVITTNRNTNTEHLKSICSLLEFSHYVDSQHIRVQQILVQLLMQPFVAAVSTYRESGNFPIVIDPQNIEQQPHHLAQDPYN